MPPHLAQRPTLTPMASIPLPQPKPLPRLTRPARFTSKPAPVPSTLPHLSPPLTLRRRLLSHQLQTEPLTLLTMLRSLPTTLHRLTLYPLPSHLITLFSPS